MKKIVLLIVIVVVAGIMGYLKYRQYNVSGCYFGDLNQKKPNTPTDWVLLYPGTRSAQWCDPVKAARMLGQ